MNTLLLLLLVALIIIYFIYWFSITNKQAVHKKIDNDSFGEYVTPINIHKPCSEDDIEMLHDIQRKEDIMSIYKQNAFFKEHQYGNINDVLNHKKNGLDAYDNVRTNVSPYAETLAIPENLNDPKYHKFKEDYDCRFDKFNMGEYIDNKSIVTDEWFECPVVRLNPSEKIEYDTPELRVGVKIFNHARKHRIKDPRPLCKLYGDFPEVSVHLWNNSLRDKAPTALKYKNYI
ncbi:hypothetical protein nvc1_041 [Namao virus]|nr:hypothetical protein nvc1_041 [Namao virus]